jgi:hypothetical protein
VILNFLSLIVLLELVLFATELFGTLSQGNPVHTSQVKFFEHWHLV